MIGKKFKENTIVGSAGINVPRYLRELRAKWKGKLRRRVRTTDSEREKCKASDLWRLPSKLDKDPNTCNSYRSEVNKMIGFVFKKNKPSIKAATLWWNPWALTPVMSGFLRICCSRGLRVRTKLGVIVDNPARYHCVY